MFQGVQQQVCIVMASRPAETDPAKPARVRFRSLPKGHREEKFTAIAALTLDSEGWAECESVFDVVEQEPSRLEEVHGTGPKRAERIVAGWAGTRG